MLTKYEWLAVYRLFFGVLAIVAIVAQLISARQLPNFDVINFFSFFTIQANILAAGLFIAVGFMMLLGVRKSSDCLAMMRGAATLYMLMTGIIYALLLSGLDVQLSLPWVNIILHYVMPIAVMIDWLIATPQPILFKRAIVWLAFPLAYAVYSLVRGFFTEWYPYPFLNPLITGYESIVWVSVIITCGAAGLTWLLTKMTRVPAARRLF